MNREIKFRAWDSIAGQMWGDVYFDGGHIYTIGPDGENASTMPRWDDNVLMQFTGLTDKNGKEIYEGDIVKFYAQSFLDSLDGLDLKEHIEPVTWNQEELCWWVGYQPDMETDNGKLEVIGNIFENKDLL